MSELTPIQRSISSPTICSTLHSQAQQELPKHGVGSDPSTLSSYSDSQLATTSSWICHYFFSFVDWVKSLWMSVTGQNNHAPLARFVMDELEVALIAEDLTPPVKENRSHSPFEQPLPSLDDDLSLDESSDGEDFVEGINEDEEVAESNGEFLTAKQWYQFKQEKGFSGAFLQTSKLVGSLIDNFHVCFPFRGAIRMSWYNGSSHLASLEACDRKSFDALIEKFQTEWQQKAEREFSDLFETSKKEGRNTHLRRLAHPQFEIDCWAFEKAEGNSYIQRKMGCYGGKLGNEESTRITEKQYNELERIESSNQDAVDPRKSAQYLKDLFNPSFLQA